MKRFLLGLASVCGLFCLVTAIAAASYYFGSSDREQELQARLAGLDQSAVASLNSSPAPGAAPSSAPLDASLLGGPAPTGMVQSQAVVADRQGTFQSELSEASHQRRQAALAFLVVSIGLAAIGLYVAHTARCLPKRLSDSLPSYSQPVQ